MTIVDDTNIKKMKTTNGQKVKNSKKTEENSNKTDQVENSPQGNYAIFKKFISCLRTISTVWPRPSQNRRQNLYFTALGDSLMHVYETICL